MPNAEEPSSPAKKAFVSIFSIIIVIIVLLVFAAIVGPKFAAYRMKENKAQEGAKPHQVEEAKR